jgi:hypothetical protein
VEFFITELNEWNEWWINGSPGSGNRRTLPCFARNVCLKSEGGRANRLGEPQRHGGAEFIDPTKLAPKFPTKLSQSHLSPPSCQHSHIPTFQ